MFVELPFEYVVAAGGAFLVGWVLSAIVSSLSARHRAKKRDPRDDRIRELEAERRIAQSELSASKAKFEAIEEELKEIKDDIERRDIIITDKQSKIEKLSQDLKESVLKTRELRAELSDRATENVHAEAKIREVETELSVAQASTDMIATGILDYSLAPEEKRSDDGDDRRKAEDNRRGVSKAAP